jgi:hypothetical protein
MLRPLPTPQAFMAVGLDRKLSCPVSNFEMAKIVVPIFNIGVETLKL